jgi:hypothetical protein
MVSMYVRSPEQRRQYRKLRCKRLRDEWLREHGPCQMCGGHENLIVHHIDPSTKVESWVWMWGKQRREEELKKCQVLCTPCHIIKTRPSVLAAIRRRIGVPCPKPTEVWQLVCSECRQTFSKRAKNERYARKTRSEGPFCGPVCRGKSAARRKWEKFFASDEMKDRTERAVALAKQGLSIREIALALKWKKRTTISRLLKERGITDGDIGS